MCELMQLLAVTQTASCDNTGSLSGPYHEEVSQYGFLYIANDIKRSVLLTFSL